MPAREWRAPLAVATLALAADATILRFFGRRWWCACGSPIPWSTEVNSRHNSQHLFDAYSPTHVLHGLAFYALAFLVARRAPLAWRFAAVAIAEAAWEMVENSSFVIERYRAATISLDYYGDSILNSLSDVGCCLFGFWLASRLPAWASLALFVAVELVLVLTIRDSLTLNVIMLVWP
ncbi:MAG TPA: DUF2585 family protein, partial [bacterium]|nr:DUF2585 family protein [bacterium]